MGRAILAVPGLRGFDCNLVVTASDAIAFKKHGYDFAVRYLPRVAAKTNDLNRVEFLGLHNAGLAVMAVQHVESDTAWNPTPEKGLLYGNGAVSAANHVGLAPATCIWLDLEGVSLRTGKADIIQYCKNWFKTIANSGYTPGIYVGWHARLNSQELWKLPFRHYWSAYNLNVDQYPAVRGPQMFQTAARETDYPIAIRTEIDINTIKPDKLGGLPMLDVPDIWDPTPGASNGIC